MRGALLMRRRLRLGFGGDVLEAAGYVRNVDER